MTMKKLLKWLGYWGICWVLLGGLFVGAVQAEPLTERMADFPQWFSKPAVAVAKDDLYYPAWFAGTWEVTSTLVEMVAPLAPNLVTPGFESNRQFLNVPISFQVRFGLPHSPIERGWLSLKALAKRSDPGTVVSDRAFNGLNLAQAYLGDRNVLAVKIDPDSPNRQITFLKGDRQLVSIVTGHATESPDPNQFVTTEIFQQMFLGAPQSYFNEVETTTAYTYTPDTETPIQADQITAIYLSPQDPEYFKTNPLGESRPVALYRYRLDFLPVD